MSRLLARYAAKAVLDDLAAVGPGAADFSAGCEQPPTPWFHGHDQIQGEVKAGRRRAILQSI